MTKATTFAQFVELVLEHIRERLAGIAPNTRLVVKEIIAKEVWESFSRGERRCVGRIVSGQAKDGLLPLAFDGKVNGNTRVYRRI